MCDLDGRIQVLPWGGKLTGESLRFFSPIVIWSRFSSSKDMYETLHGAFMDYLKVRYLFVLDRRMWNN